MNRTTGSEEPAAAGLTDDDIELTPWDSSEFLDSPEAIAVYLNEALAVGDAQSFAYCLGQAAKAAGMTEIARRAGVSRQSLYDALSGNAVPPLDAILGVLGALGVRLVASGSTVPAAVEEPAEALEAAHG